MHGAHLDVGRGHRDNAFVARNGKASPRVLTRLYLEELLEVPQHKASDLACEPGYQSTRRKRAMRETLNTYIPAMDRMERTSGTKLISLLPWGWPTSQKTTLCVG